MEKKVLITTDNVCDLPEDILKEYDIPAIHFYITTDHGCFRDLDEITSANIIEYFENGGKHIATQAPSVTDYEDFFDYELANRECDEIIHITITADLSKATDHASKAAEKFNGKIHVFNSMHLSTGVAHLVLRATELASQGKTRDEILTVLESLREKVCTSFLTENADYLYRNNRVSKFVKDFCELLHIHPVLGMRNGTLYLKSLLLGSYNKAIIRYAQSELRRSGRLDSKRIFIVHADCSIKMISSIKNAIQSQSYFEEIIVTKASATISSNCGANAVAIIFVKE